MYKKVVNIILVMIVIGVSILGMVSPVYARGGLTPIERDGLLFMREEEKLARDVYIYLYNQYGLNIFQNISRSEQNHMDAMLSLLNNYSLPDPASPLPGVFNNQELQGLYNSLIVWGSQSLSAALRVGGTIEEVDILDLEYYLAHTNKNNIQQVYGNLLRASENHLRAFVSTLFNQTGEIYEPLYLDPVRYQEIIDGGGGCRGRRCEGG